jgi:hypothetical protein
VWNPGCILYPHPTSQLPPLVVASTLARQLCSLEPILRNPIDTPSCSLRAQRSGHSASFISADSTKPHAQNFAYLIISLNPHSCAQEGYYYGSCLSEQEVGGLRGDVTEPGVPGTWGAQHWTHFSCVLSIIELPLNPQLPGSATSSVWQLRLGASSPPPLHIKSS